MRLSNSICVVVGEVMLLCLVWCVFSSCYGEEWSSFLFHFHFIWSICHTHTHTHTHTLSFCNLDLLSFFLTSYPACKHTHTHTQPCINSSILSLSLSLSFYIYYNSFLQFSSIFTTLSLSLTWKNFSVGSTSISRVSICSSVITLG